jgi:hypothetical protein
MKDLVGAVRSEKNESRSRVGLDRDGGWLRRVATAVTATVWDPTGKLLRRSLLAACRLSVAGARVWSC